MNYISAMELTTLLNKTKVSVSNLTIYEHRFLSFLLARVHSKSMPTHGYLAWPGIDEIQDYTGISSTQIARIRKSLVQTGWMQYLPGIGAGNSNHYYINAQKIVDCAVSSGERQSDKPVAKTVLGDKPKPQHKRNTDNLVQNRVKNNNVGKPKEPVKIDTEFVPRYHRGSWAATEADIKRIDYEQLLDDEESPF